MGVVDTVKGLLAGSAGSASGSRKTEPDWTGAYWCLDCGHRLLDVDAGSADPDCPECGGEMAFERSMNAGCGC